MCAYSLFYVGESKATCVFNQTVCFWFVAVHILNWWTWRESNPLTSRLQGVSATHRPGPCYFSLRPVHFEFGQTWGWKATPPPTFTKVGKFVRIVFVARQPKFSFKFAEPILYFGPDTRIRTLDLLIPNQARYQTALHPDILAGVHGIEPCSQGFGDLRIASFPHPCNVWLLVLGSNQRHSD